MTVAPTTVRAGQEQHRSRWVLLAILAFLLGGLSVALLYHYDVFGGSSGSTGEGSGVAATQVRHVGPFRGIELSGANNVLVHVGAKQSVVVKGDENLVGRVTTAVRSGTLVVGNTPGSFKTKLPMSVEIGVPKLDAVALTGSGNIVVDGVAAKSLEVTLPGSGDVTGSGTATRLDVTVGGSGVVQLSGLVARDVRAVVSGSGSIFVTATGSLHATVSGSGAILYAGSPQSVTKNVTGSGAITGG